jgi:phage terminase large subunit-like protein
VSADRAIASPTLRKWRASPLDFIESVLHDPETGKPFKLLPAQRAFLEHAFTLDESGRLVYRELVFSCPKKSGKTTFEAIVVLTMTILFGGTFPEAFFLANDQEQARSRGFEICCRIVRASPLLRDEANITQGRIVFPSFNATIQAIASDAGGAAGSNAVIAAFDELWAYTSERSRRLWDEMTPPPTRKVACRLTVTYAGFEGESVLLEELYRRGLAQPLIGDSLYAGDGLLMAWHHKPVAPWQDEAWIADMRRQRASVFQRHVLNEFASSSSQFVDLTKWDRCINPDLGQIRSAPETEAFVGIDASVKHDSCAIVAVTYDRSTQLVRLLTRRIFQPSPSLPLDFENTIEATVLDLNSRFALRKVLYDPYQMVATAQRLLKAGVPMQEFPQSVPNLTQASQTLFELIESQALVMPPDADMRLAVSRCVAAESSRGWRIAKDRQSFKIDVIVALAQACHAAVSTREVPDVPIVAPIICFGDGSCSEPSLNTPQQTRTKSSTALYYEWSANGGGGTWSGLHGFGETSRPSWWGR